MNLKRQNFLGINKKTNNFWNLIKYRAFRFEEKLCLNIISGYSVYLRLKKYF